MYFDTVNHLTSRQFAIFSLVAVLALGFFLRAYHFSDWLHFELDQARDMRVVDRAIEGDFFDLPLLGPKAGGTALRLPPVFYVLEYVSAFLFGASPQGVAMLTLALSSAAILVFFFFVRRYFSEKLALSLTLLFSVSEFFVMYGRFAWNPNFLPFFILLGMYGLLRAVDHENARRGRWFLLSVASIGIAMQFHFLAFLALPTIVGVFLLFRRVKFGWKIWGGALVIIAVLYFPMFLNEIETGFANSKAFVAAVTEKSGKEDHSLPEKLLRNVSEHALYGMVITTGFERGRFPSITLENGFDWKCDARCDTGKWYGIAAVITLGWSLLTLIGLWWRETERHKKDFLLLSGIWFSVTFVLFIPLAYGMAPRFFLISGPLFFVLIGCVLAVFKGFFGGRKIGRQILLIVILVLVSLNFSSLLVRFDEIGRSQTEAVDSPPDRILKERIRVTYRAQERIVDFLERRSRETKYPVYMWSEPQHRRALKYLLDRRDVTNAVLGVDGVYRQGVYFLVLRAQSDLDDALRKYREKYTIGETTNFGTLVVIELFPKSEAIGAERQDFSLPKPIDMGALPRYTWREFFHRNTASSPDDAADAALDAAEDEAVNEDTNDN